MLELILTGFLVGLGGSIHCVGMCGPVIMAFSLSTKNQTFNQTAVSTIAYNFGRITTYTLLGLLAGLLSSVISNLGFLIVFRWLAAILLVFTALYLLGISRYLLILEKPGGWVWQKIKPISQKLNPGRSLINAIFAGMLWGLLPCGLVYAAMGMSASYGSMELAACFMLAFGLGTFLPMILVGVGFSRVTFYLRKSAVKWAIALTMIAMSVFYFWQLLTDVDHSKHVHQQPVDENSHSHHH